MTHPYKQQDFLSFTRDHEWGIEQTIEFTLDNGCYVQVWDSGVIVFEPNIDITNKDLIFSCGVHGNETGPIELCNELVHCILDQKISLKHRVMFLFGNPAAMNIGERFVEENMNCLFSGVHSQEFGLVNRERIRAKKLEQYVIRFFGENKKERIHYDLHTAIRGSKNEKFAVYPYLHDKKYNQQQLQIMLSCGVNTILLSTNSTATFSYFSSYHCQAHSFTIELGKVRPFGGNDMTRFIEIKETLTLMMTGKDMQLSPYQNDDFNIFTVSRSIVKNNESFKFYFADDAVNFSSFPVGFKLASEGDMIYKIETEGEAIVFPNAKVANGNRAVLMVAPTTMSLESFDS